MQTVARFTPEYDPRWSVAARAIPDRTPTDALHRLKARYADPNDATVARLPDGYRVAVAARIRQLLAQSVTGGAA